MNIIFGNQKGGAGKTTHCLLFANYLAIEKKQELLLLDMDFQTTITGQWNADRENFDNPSFYEVITVDLADSQNIMAQIADVSGYVLMDLPGKMDDNDLQPIFKQADLLVCPFAYDKFSFESTVVFVQVVKYINPRIPVVFIPNRIKSGVKYDTMEQVQQKLEQFGKVAPAITDRIAFQRLDTLSIPEEVQDQLQRTYGFIYDEYLLPETVK